MAQAPDSAHLPGTTVRILQPACGGLGTSSVAARPTLSASPISAGEGDACLGQSMRTKQGISWIAALGDQKATRKSSSFSVHCLKQSSLLVVPAGKGETLGKSGLGTVMRHSCRPSAWPSSRTKSTARPWTDTKPMTSSARSERCTNTTGMPSVQPYAMRWVLASGQFKSLSTCCMARIWCSGVFT